MSEFVYFVLGILFGVPTSVVSTWVTPKLLRARSARHARAWGRLRAELRRCEQYAADPARFATHLLERVLVVMLTGTIATLVPEAVRAAGYAVCAVGRPGSAGRDPYGVVGYTAVASSVLTVLGAVAVLALSARALRTHQRVARLDRGRRSVGHRADRVVGAAGPRD